MKKLRYFLKIFQQKFKEDRIFNQSAALTYFTLLGFLPFLVFIFFLIPELPFIPEKALEDLLISIFVPNSALQIGEFIGEFTAKKVSLNLFSFILLIITAYTLFKIINDTFDKILGVTIQEKSNFLNNMLKFLGTCLGGVLLLLILVSSASVPLITKFIRIPFLHAILTWLSPFLIMFIIFTLGFIFIPNTRVKNSAVLIGAGGSALFWIIFKSAFDLYIQNLTNFELIYGMISFIPIYFIWIYANWTIILSGVVLVTILDDRIIAEEPALPHRTNLRIIIEKELEGSSIETLMQDYIESEDLKKLLQEILKEEKVHRKFPRVRNLFTKKER